MKNNKNININISPLIGDLLQRIIKKEIITRKLDSLFDDVISKNYNNKIIQELQELSDEIEKQGSKSYNRIKLK